LSNTLKKDEVLEMKDKDTHYKCCKEQAYI